jgi:hypothetical protein
MQIMNEPHRSIPQRHVEIGLNGIHRVAVTPEPWLRRLLRRTPWSDVFYVCTLIALVVLAIFLSGRSIEFPS